MDTLKTMAIYKCCVGGCDSTSNNNRLFCMPMNDGLRNLWISFLSPTNPDLLTFTKNQLMKKRVCEKHFDKSQFDRAGGRIRYSYPCLLTEKEMLYGVPLSIKEHTLVNEHNYCSFDEIDLNSTKALVVMGKQGKSDDRSSDIIHLPELIEIPGAPDDPKTHKVYNVKINLLNNSIEYIDNDKVKKGRKETQINPETKIENLNDDKPKNLPLKTLKKVPRPKNIEELKMQNKLFKIKLAKVDSIDDEDDFGEPEKKRRKIDDINAQDLNFYEVDVNDEEISNNITNKISEKSTQNLVLHHHSFLKEKLISVLNSHRFCALCLESNKPLKSFDEQIIIINDNWTQTILLKDVYSCVFKEEKSASGFICTECTEKLQHSYIFIKYSQLTTQLLESYIDDLKFKTTDTLKHLNTNESVKVTNTVLILESDDVNKYLHKQKGTNEYLHKEKGTNEYIHKEKGTNEYLYKGKGTNEYLHKEKGTNEYLHKEKGTNEYLHKEKGTNEYIHKEKGTNEYLYKGKGTNEYLHKEKGTNEYLHKEKGTNYEYLHKEKGTNEYLHKEKEEKTIETEIDNIETEIDNETEKQIEQNCDLNCECLKCKKLPILLLKQPEIVAIETKPKQYKKVKRTNKLKELQTEMVQKFEIDHKKLPLVFFKQPLIESMETKATLKPVINSKKRVIKTNKTVMKYKKPVRKRNAK